MAITLDQQPPTVRRPWLSSVVRQPQWVAMSTAAGKRLRYYPLRFSLAYVDPVYCLVPPLGYEMAYADYNGRLRNKELFTMSVPSLCDRHEDQ